MLWQKAPWSNARSYEHPAASNIECKSIIKHWSALLSSTTCRYILLSWNYWLARGPADLVLQAVLVLKHLFSLFSLLGNESHLTCLAVEFCMVCSSLEYAKHCSSCRVLAWAGHWGGSLSLWSKGWISHFVKTCKNHKNVGVSVLCPSCLLHFLHLYLLIPANFWYVVGSGSASCASAISPGLKCSMYINLCYFWLWNFGTCGYWGYTSLPSSYPIGSMCRFFCAVLARVPLCSQPELQHN